MKSDPDLEKILRLAEALVEDILSASDDETAAELNEDGQIPQHLKVSGLAALDSALRQIGDKNMQAQKTVEDLIEERAPHRVVHVDQLDWKKVRWPGEWGKIAFHPRPDNPTEPIVGITKFEPGGGFPNHAHDFSQVWYILEGDCILDGQRMGPGTIVFHPDPHVEREMRTENGVTIFFCQYPGPTTGGRPIYHDRFNLDRERRDASEEPTTI